ncbi:MAG: peptidylprolyl isomerase [Planctomycetes bacterium]|nr:peptidylprolyl isomerase [Planctomycetota bacterium]
MKRLSLYFVLLLMPVCSSLFAQGELVKATLVVINGTRITQDDLNEMAEYLLKAKYKPKDGQPIRLTQDEEREIWDSSLRELIKMRLIFDEASKLGLNNDDEDVERQLNRMGVEASTAPVVMRKIASADLLVDQVLAAKGFPPYKPSPKEIRDVWEEQKDSFRTNAFVRVRHIILPTIGEDNPDVVAAKAKLLRDKLLEKAPDKRSELFAEMAKEFSDGAFAEHGGLLHLGKDKEGWFPQEFGNKRPDGSPIFPETLYKAIQAFTHKDKHNVSKVIRSELGFHLLFLEDIKGGKQIAWTEAQKLIRIHLEQKVRKERMLEWLKAKAEESKILWHDGEVYPANMLFEEEKKD